MSKNQSAERVAVVTGAGRRVGAAITQILHQQGFNVAVHYLASIADAQSNVDRFNAERPDSAIAIRADLSEPAAAKAIVSEVLTKWGRLDALINNASIFDPTPLLDFDDALSTQLMDINFAAPLRLSLAAARALKMHRGAIVNVSDIHAERPRKDYLSYCVSKAALNALTRSLALDLAPEVRVNSVAPGAVLWAPSDDEPLQQTILDRTPLARRGEPADIANTVAFLLNAEFVTGQIIPVDGGQTIRL
ncbi:MAG: pteridine reductase [Pseudomonadota bacterium]